MERSIYPTYKHVIYEFNPQNSHYQKTSKQPEPHPCKHLPFMVMREKSFGENIKYNASECLTIPSIKKDTKSKKIVTGLQSTNFANWFSGDTYRMQNGKKLKSTLIINFTPCNQYMHIFYYSGFFKTYPTDRLQWVNSQVTALK